MLETCDLFAMVDYTHSLPLYIHILRLNENILNSKI